MSFVQSYDLSIPVRARFELDAKALTEALAALGLDVWIPPTARLSTSEVDYVPVQVRAPQGIIHTGITLSAPEGWNEPAEAAGDDDENDGDEESDEEDDAEEDADADEESDEDAEADDDEESDEDEDTDDEDEDGDADDADADDDEDAEADDDEESDEDDTDDEDEDDDEEADVFLEGEVGVFTIYAKNAPIPADENEVPLAWFVACALAKLGNGAVVDPQQDGKPYEPAALAELLRQQRGLFDPRLRAWEVYPYDLFNALDDGDVEVVLREIRRGASLAARDAHGNTPLQLAFANGMPELGRLFLQWGADLFAVNRWGRIVIEAALNTEDAELIRELIARGAPVGDLAFRIAARDAAPARLACLLDAGYPVHAVTPDGWTLAGLAAQAGSVANMEVLLDRGADPRVPNRAGRTPLALAREHGHTEVVEALLARGVLH